MNSNLENFVPQVMMVRKKETGQVYAMKALDKREVAVSERCVIISLFSYEGPFPTSSPSLSLLQVYTQLKIGEEYTQERSPVPGAFAFLVSDRGQIVFSNGLHLRR